MFRVSLLLPAIALLSACATAPRVTTPAPPAPPPVWAAAPTPPDRAAPNLKIPARLADGSYATLNRGLSSSASLWHLRAAFNVAALNCPDPALAPAYNRLLVTGRRELAAAHRALMAEYRDREAFDPAMTRLYNYFAQPPVMARFCAAAAPLLHQATALPAGSLGDFATPAIIAIDRPFSEFYARYDAWRNALAAWNAGTSTTPRLDYDPAAFTTAAIVTGGNTKLAAR